VIAGAVAYSTPPTAPVADDEALLCCAVPAGGDPAFDRLILDV
jgi:uncharacterized protein